MKIVQVGACKGNDHVTKLIKENNIDFLLFVEANPFNIDDLKSCYADYECIVENIVINVTESDETIPFYYSINDGPGYEVSSIKKSHTMMYYSEDMIRHFDLPSTTITNLLNKYNIKELDYLFLDIEGIDAEIALSLDLNSFFIKNIQIEFLHLGHRHAEVIQYFNSHGYELQDGIDFHGYDKMFSKK
jgi:FkbM family methyltransferase